jgi:hypothetical protein
MLVSDEFRQRDEGNTEILHFVQDDNYVRLPLDRHRRALDNFLNDLLCLFGLLQRG